MKINPQFLKFVIVGDTGTGKRTLLSPYGVPPRLSPLYLPIEVNEIIVKGETQKWKVLVSDSLLLEEDIPVKDDKLARKLLSTAMNGTHAVFLCYRKDDWKTFQNLYAWYKSVSFYFSNTTLVYLVETMGDKATNDIKPLELKAFIKNNGIIKQFKTKKDDIEGIQAMFTEAVIEVEKAIAQLNIQLSSPRKINNSGNLSGRSGSGNRVSVIYTDKNEEVKLVDGSYIKKPKVPDTAKESHEMLEAKNLTDEKVELEAI